MNPFDTRSATFDEPVEMLYACHGKVRAFCRQTAMLPAYMAEHGRNEAVLQAVRQISRYFNVAAPLHHQDEEEDFFPLLLRYFPDARNTVAELHRQHENLHACWEAVEREFAAIEADAGYRPQSRVLRDFDAAYAAHLALEEPLFETGRRLPAAELAAIGRNMAARRKG